MIKEENVLRAFDRYDLREQESRYLEYHCKRLTYTLNFIGDYKRKYRLGKLLDIGPHFLTCCISEFYPDIEISTLGWKYESIVPDHIYKEHVQYDLNDADCKELHFDQGPFDLIIFAETIEHLHTSPAVVLALLKKLLASDGSIFVQTPNAAALGSRLMLLAGRNPYELIRLDKKNPGHFREYTIKELSTYAKDAGFLVESAKYCSYWPLPIPVLNQLGNIIPSFRRGIAMLIRND